MDTQGDAALSAEERKRKRLAAWKRKKLQQSPPALVTKVSLTLKPTSKLTAPKKKPKLVSINAFGESDSDGEAQESEAQESAAPSLKRKSVFDLEEEQEKPKTKRAKKGGRRWDNPPKKEKSPAGKDALDEFMEKLEAGAEGMVTVGKDGDFQVDVNGSMVRESAPTHDKKSKTTSSQLYQPNEWLSDAPTDDEQEEDARRALIKALTAQPVPMSQAEADGDDEEEGPPKPAQLASEVRSEKARREQRLVDLEKQAAEARASARSAAQPKFGRLFMDSEGGVMEEAERNLDAAKAKPDALVVLADLNKKKELKAVDHSKIEYLPLQKNLYRVPRSLANLAHDDVTSRRAKLKVRVRGHGAPAPVSTFEECGLSERILQVLKSQEITQPFAVQAQCIPCIMAGRDVIGIAKTGSGKTLAYLLPMLRHILVQPPLATSESGPVGLILAPARELAFQIHSVCKTFAKPLGLK